MPDLNPFFHRGPVKDPAYFFGRGDERRFIADLLRAGQSVSLSGPRRMGKTSLLFNLTQPEVASALGLSSACWVYIDGGMLDGLDTEWFFGAIDRTLGGNNDTVPYSHFVETVRTLAAQNQRLILALDEFELIAANPHFGTTLFNRLRGLAAQFPLQFITASCDPLGQLTFAHRETLSSPFFNIFAPARLNLLTESEAAALLQTLSAQQNQPFSPETIAFLLKLTGPHPLFLQVAGYRAFAVAEPDGGLLPDARHIVRSQIQTDLEQHLHYYWRNLSSEAHYTLATLPLQEKAASKSLTAAGLLHGDDYLGDILEAFVRRQAVNGVLQNGPFLLDERRSLAAAYGQPLHLTPTELSALRLFLKHAGQVITPEAIEAAIWPDEIAPDPDRARGVVKKLRAALGPAAEAIVNRRGQGWLLEISA